MSRIESYTLYGLMLSIGTLVYGYQTSLVSFVIFVFVKTAYSGGGYGLNALIRIIPQITFTIFVTVLIGFLNSVFEMTNSGTFLELSNNGVFVIGLALLIPSFFEYKDQNTSINAMNKYVGDELGSAHMELLKNQYTKKADT